MELTSMKIMAILFGGLGAVFAAATIALDIAKPPTIFESFDQHNAIFCGMILILDLCEVQKIAYIRFWAQILGAISEKTYLMRIVNRNFYIIRKSTFDTVINVAYLLLTFVDIFRDFLDEKMVETTTERKVRKITIGIIILWVGVRYHLELRKMREDINEDLNENSTKLKHVQQRYREMEGALHTLVAMIYYLFSWTKFGGEALESGCFFSVALFLILFKLRDSQLRMNINHVELQSTSSFSVNQELGFL